MKPSLFLIALVFVLAFVSIGLFGLLKLEKAVDDFALRQVGILQNDNWAGTRDVSGR